VDFPETGLQESLNFVALQCKEAEPGNPEISFRIDPQVESTWSAEGAEPRITLAMQDIPVIELVRHIADSSKMRVIVSGSGVTSVPDSAVSNVAAKTPQTGSEPP
jgi:hypothetical protein